MLWTFFFKRQSFKEIGVWKKGGYYLEAFTFFTFLLIIFLLDAKIDYAFFQMFTSLFISSLLFCGFIFPQLFYTLKVRTIKRLMIIALLFVLWFIPLLYYKPLHLVLFPWGSFYINWFVSLLIIFIFFVSAFFSRLISGSIYASLFIHPLYIAFFDFGKFTGIGLTLFLVLLLFILQGEQNRLDMLLSYRMNTLKVASQSFLALIFLNRFLIKTRVSDVIAVEKRKIIDDINSNNIYFKDLQYSVPL